MDVLRDSPWDAVIAVGVIATIAGIRLVRRAQLHTGGLAVAGLDLATQLLLVILGLALLFSPDVLTQGMSLGRSPSWSDLAFALPLAMLAYTGLETVANLAEETREPGRTLPRSLFSAIGLVVVLTALIAVVGLSAFPVENGETALGEEWLKAPLAGIVEALEPSLPGWLGDALRIYVGLTGALVLLAAATTSISGFTRLAYSLGEHRQLPRSFGRLNRRTLVSPQAIVAAAAISITLVIVSSALADDVIFLASLYSFGVLVAFAAAQLAVLRLRMTEPDLARPFRAPLAAPLIGAPLVIGVWILAMVTHPGARYAGPAWLALGVVVYLLVRRRERSGLLHEVNVIEELPPGRRVPAGTRTDEARPDRGGDGRDRRRARQGAGRDESMRSSSSSSRSSMRSTRRSTSARNRQPPRSPRPCSSGRRTTCTSSRSRCAPGRSARRFWNRR